MLNNAKYSLTALLCIVKGDGNITLRTCKCATATEAESEYIANDNNLYLCVTLKTQTYIKAEEIMNSSCFFFHCVFQN